ncbi:hypothetical protein JRO89_XS08G0052600 [Xanthoceras sorbifolium]|uniref:FAD dependent oxidoreductase domain-containing protein n=1 Tax=Xanthoceras sorbifolium TaxID=99658 RepID=A0ABQ8HNQ4_9ROSI|nr:hypothetical protein JRO89_XS08G0052600 [Xanthoceras sorbifolium]
MASTAWLTDPIINKSVAYYKFCKIHSWFWCSDRDINRVEDMAEEKEVVIVGARIVGLASAVTLKRLGIRALVLERFEDLRATDAALTLFPNAWLHLMLLVFLISQAHFPLCSCKQLSSLTSGSFRPDGGKGV